MLTHANFCAVLSISNHWDHHNVSRGMERALAVLPLFHIFGLTFIMLLGVANGEQVVLHIKFDPDRVLADISRKKITVFLGVPTMYTALVNHPKVKEFDLSSVRRWVSGGAPLAKCCSASKLSPAMLPKRDMGSPRPRPWERFRC